MNKGTEFELYIAQLLERAGCDVEWTGTGADYGVDLIATYENTRIAIQCKCYENRNVGNQAVQAVIAGMKLYDCQKAAVITNSKFTGPAQVQADANQVLLIPGDELMDIQPDFEGNITPFDRLLGLAWRLPEYQS